MLTRDDLRVMACPVCHNALRFIGDRRGGRLRDGIVRCRGCSRDWSVEDGVVHMVQDDLVTGMDRILRPIYDLIAPVHDLGVDLLLPVLQFPDFGASRDHYIERLDLDQLVEPAEPRPLRILEIGVGAGANLSLIEAAVPSPLDVELWGVDLSPGMLAQCRRNLERSPVQSGVRLLLADAHALPFPDATFDRVLHVGAINGYRDRRRALAEMARVARPGTPIVVVDEELDPRRSHALYHRLAFFALTVYDANPHAPEAELPLGAIDVQTSAVSRFYYCLRFAMPA
jgi:ubiquinone/menaquinone biosynthesis C-methylase UbiE/uncharacterized protein YbaR (Trm112 family)